MIQRRIGRTDLVIMEGDITDCDEEAVVNPANEELKHGGGVAGLIVRKGGEIIQTESDRMAPCPVGSAVVTTAGNLKSDYVIHTVGPRWGEGDEDRKLSSAVRATLAAAENKGIRSLAMPAISTGIFGFPMERAAVIILNVIQSYLDKAPALDRVVVCLYGQKAYELFARCAEVTYE